jgi:plasmid stability protein
MAQLLIEDVAEATVAKLKERASHHGRSLQQELKFILEEAARQNSAESWEAIHQFRRRLQESERVFSDSTDLLREDRER